MPSGETPIDIPAALRRAYPELEEAIGAAVPIYLVGGAVRDLLLGRERFDVDLVVVGDLGEALNRLGGTLSGMSLSGRFNTAYVDLGEHRVDLAEARTELYPQPGALPVVEPARSIEADLVRRDFSVNAMAVPLGGEAPRLLDPHGGREDLERGLLRVLHPDSFADDPTRAIRAARYAARLGFELEPETARLLAATDLGTISADRRERELQRLAREETGVRGLELLAGWGLIEPRPGGLELAARAAELWSTRPWREADRSQAVLAAALGPAGGEGELAAARPERPSQAVELVGGRDPAELLLARALGAEWLDRYMEEWRSVSLEIDGSDLLAAGVPEGPALGRGLRAALRAKLDGKVSGREPELATALEAAAEE
jgi:tRNA nucleotidyltransferase (CCA-adding enzyme)